MSKENSSQILLNKNIKVVFFENEKEVILTEKNIKSFKKVIDWMNKFNEHSLDNETLDISFKKGYDNLKKITLKKELVKYIGFCKISKLVIFFHRGLERNINHANKYYKKEDKDNKENFKFCKWMKDVENNKHARKHLISRGSYIEKEKENKGYLGFWGEWEGESLYVKNNKHKLESKDSNKIPKNFHFPTISMSCRTEKYKSGEKYKRGSFMNTDPCVFGKQFIYSNCMQEDYNILKSLEMGDIVIFGSAYKSNGSKKVNTLMIDTVFVVDECKEDFINNSFKDYKDWYDFLTVRFLKKQKNINLNLYFGATYESPVNEMFSFFPCQVNIDDNYEGFRRLDINYEMTFIEDIKDMYGNDIKLKEGDNRGITHFEIDEKDMLSIWKGLKKQTLGKNLKIGVRADPWDIDEKNVYEDIKKLIEKLPSKNRCSN